MILTWVWRTILTLSNGATHVFAMNEDPPPHINDRMNFLTSDGLASPFVAIDLYELAFSVEALLLPARTKQVVEPS